jgi:hypothetical protein
MAIAREFFGPGWSGDDYDKLIEAMDLGGDAAPGVLFHWAAVTDAGVHAVDVYSSVEAADNLVATRVGPASAKLGLAAPEIRQYAVRNFLTPA